MTAQSDDDPGRRKPQLLQLVVPGYPLDDSNLIYDEEVPEDVREAIKAVLREYPELWFVEAKTKDGKSVLAHRGPHP